jgi:hypothetical protein
MRTAIACPREREVVEECRGRTEIESGNGVDGGSLVQKERPVVHNRVGTKALVRRAGEK